MTPGTLIPAKPSRTQPSRTQAPRAKPRHGEAVEQRLFVQRLRLDARTRDLPACAVPNGGRRGRLEAALLKGEGVSAGVPDWLCFQPSDTAHGLALEFKTPHGTGRVSPAQKEWHEKLRRAGWRVEVVTSAEAAWQVLCDHLGVRP